MRLQPQQSIKLVTVLMDLRRLCEISRCPFIETIINDYQPQLIAMLSGGIGFCSLPVDFSLNKV